MRPGLLLALLLFTMPPAGADEVSVRAVQIERFGGVAAGEPLGQLVFRGGLVLSSREDTFGGISGLGFVSPESHFAMVSDSGRFISGRLLYDEAMHPLALGAVEIEPIRNSAGEPLPRAFARDAEALAVVYRDGVPAAVRVGFENLTRIADFSLSGHRPGGPAREVAIPSWLSELRTNRAIESVCIAPPASPVAGSTLILAEGARDRDGLHRGTLLGNRDRGDLAYRATSGRDPTDCAFLPDGDLLVLERGVAMFSFTMALVRVPAADLAPGAVLSGTVLLETGGGEIDNMEALAVHPAPDGETRITIVSDDNFSDWQRTLLLQFALAD